MVRRFGESQFPYQLITPEEWVADFALYPTYLPMTWAPFLVAGAIGLDYRWWALLLLLLSLLFFVGTFVKYTGWRTLLIVLAAYLILDQFYVHERPDFSMTVETLIVAYYLLLAGSLINGSPLLLSVALLCCLLSRYSVVLWVPLHLLVLWLEQPKQIGCFQRRSLTTLVSVLLGGFLLLYFPFLLQDFSIFQKGLAYHQEATLNIWQQKAETPDILLKGIGFGAVIYEYWPGDVANRLQVYQYLHLTFCAFTITGLAIWYYRYRESVNQRLFLLASLKIYLVVFYHFIHLPFHYLFLVPVFINVPMIAVLLSMPNERVVVPKDQPTMASFRQL
ncbi:MAG: hypothetical protein AAFO94_11410 [Bacteroidota bacterium]